MSSPDRAVRASFDRLHPISLPHRLSRLPERVWSEDEWSRIERGNISRSMDDKWDIFVEDNTVFLHRSWTGRGIFELAVEQVAGGRRPVSATVERDPERYRGTDDEADSILLELIISGHLLGEETGELRERWKDLVQPG